jgi:hypothetical protein
MFKKVSFNFSVIKLSKSAATLPDPAQQIRELCAPAVGNGAESC